MWYSWWSRFFLSCLLLPVPLSKHLGTVPSAPTTTGITVTFMFYRFLLVLWQGLSVCQYFCFFFFHSVVRRNGKIYKSASCQFLLLLLLISDRVQLGDPFVSQNYYNLLWLVGHLQFWLFTHINLKEKKESLLVLIIYTIKIISIQRSKFVK